MGFEVWGLGIFAYRQKKKVPRGEDKRGTRPEED